MEDEIWGVNIIMDNNTNYKMNLTGVHYGPVVLDPLTGTTEWTEIVKDFTLTIELVDENEVTQVTGNFKYNSTDGVVFDRGNMTTQAVTVDIYVDGENTFNETQNTNGSLTVCSWEDVIKGFNLKLTYN
jgi:hypothetical protein